VLLLLVPLLLVLLLLVLLLLLLLLLLSFVLPRMVVGFSRPLPQSSCRLLPSGKPVSAAVVRALVGGVVLRVLPRALYFPPPLPRDFRTTHFRG
jgi:hypothetical protein